MRRIRLLIRLNSPKVSALSSKDIALKDCPFSMHILLNAARATDIFNIFSNTLYIHVSLVSFCYYIIQTE